MRKKSLAVRSSRLKSLDPSPSLPVEQLGSRVINNNTECEADDENVPDNIDERRRDAPHQKRARGESVGEGLKPLDLEACIVCDISDERVLHCHGTGCLLSFHTDCVDAESENPYCPYCWFKILALKSKSLREDVVVAKKAVDKYLGKEQRSTDDATDSGDDNGNQEHRVDACSSEEEQVDKDCRQSRGENIRLFEDRGGLEVGTDKEVESLEDEERRVAVHGGEDHRRAKGNIGAGKKRDASSFLSMQESSSRKEHEQNERPSRRKRQLILNDSELSSNKQNGDDDPTDEITSSTQFTSQSGQTTKVARSNTGRDVSFFKESRRRQSWTVKEEEMLTMGVEKFAAKANKNMPWKKILEMGKNVFDKNRTPADLKDKWRHMVKKSTTKH